VSGGSLESLCDAAAARASEARTRLALLSGGERRQLLIDIAAAIRAGESTILAANALDLAAAESLDAAMRDRLRLDSTRLNAMADAVVGVADQPDPVGRVVDGRVLPNGIRLEKRRVPIGVVLVIYESRPNVTSDAAALCLKSGNAVLLKGGKEAAHTNRAVAGVIENVLAPRGLGGAVTFVDTTDRRAVEILVKMRGRIDLAIPRGGPGLIKAVTDAATIPVVKHDAGNCHVYLDEHLDGLEDAAEKIVVNAKAQRPGVCNAVETLLVHRAAAATILPRVGAALMRAGVELRCCPRSLEILGKSPHIDASRLKPATDDDWATEYLALILAVRVVDSLEDACAHIRTWGSQHTEAIVTSSIASAQRFTALVDSASVMVNCSTRFADGGEYQLGAEIGISTDKLHARGPMGAEDLTTFQWVLTGNGQVRGHTV
jgi:glutamate-5-semialdehyde dehydrogenase